MSKANEVLLCGCQHGSGGTVLCQATSNSNNLQIFYIVNINAHNLSDDIVEKADEKLGSLVHSGNILVKMCNKENTGKTHLVIVLDKC